MEWDEACKVLEAAGYVMEHFADDEWQLWLIGQPYPGAVVRQSILISLAQAISRARALALPLTS